MPKTPERATLRPITTGNPGNVGLIVYQHHGRKTIADAYNIQRNYSISAGAMLAKQALRNPLKYAPVLIHTKNALLEILSGGKNYYMPHIGFSYRNLVACFATGTVRFASASVHAPFIRHRERAA